MTERPWIECPACGSVDVCLLSWAMDQAKTSRRFSCGNCDASFTLDQPLPPGTIRDTGALARS